MESYLNWYWSVTDSWRLELLWVLWRQVEQSCWYFIKQGTIVWISSRFSIGKISGEIKSSRCCRKYIDLNWPKSTVLTQNALFLTFWQVLVSAKMVHFNVNLIKVAILSLLDGLSWVVHCICILSSMCKSKEVVMKLFQA